MKVKFKLYMYLSGKTPSKEKLITHIKAILDDVKGLDYKLETINILEHPEVAVERGVLATPLLEKSFPKPVRRIIGDLEKSHNILMVLGLVNQKG